MASDIYFQITVQKVCAFYSVTTSRERTRWTTLEALGLFINCWSCFIFHIFSPNLPPILQPHRMTHIPPPNDSAKLLCLCTSYYPPSPLLKNILSLICLLTIRLTLYGTGSFHTICKTQLKYPFLSELVAILPSRASHSYNMWCLEGPLTSKCSPRSSPSLILALCPSLRDSPLSPPLSLSAPAVAKLCQSSPNRDVGAIHLSLPSPLALTADKDSCISLLKEKKKSTMYMVQKFCFL